MATRRDVGRGAEVAMAPGALRHRVTVQKNTPTKNAVGEEVPGWAAVPGVGSSGEVAARVSPLRGRERWAAQQVAAEATHEAGLRYFPGLEHEMRLLFRGRVLNIEAVMDVDERRRRILLLCTEEKA